MPPEIDQPSKDPQGPDVLQDLSLLIRSRYSIIFLRTEEEDRAQSLLRHLASHLDLPFFSWTRSQGLSRGDGQAGSYGTEKLQRALAHIRSSPNPAVYQLRVHHADLEDPLILECLREAEVGLRHNHGALVFTGTDLEVPESVRASSALLELPAPALRDYRDLLQNILRDLETRQAVSYELGEGDLRRILTSLSGLTLLEAEKVLTKAVVEDGKLSGDDISHVSEAKREIVEREGLLEYYPSPDGLAEIAGLATLKEWLAQRREMILDPERAAHFGLDFPKGILLTGVPGCGKSLCAKAVAHAWGLPLLRLDPSNLYRKYIGESERNFKRAIRTAERLAPVILWIDELEKAFTAAGEEDGGTSQRIFGSFLSWMQERRQEVFVVATANDVHRLPAEFLRKGRFDEIFFLDLPDAETRQAIFEIHLRKRGWEPERLDLSQLVEASAGFSGGGIESVILAALFTAFSRRVELSTELLLEELQATQPLGVVMAERIAELRAWAQGRVRPAH